MLLVRRIFVKILALFTFFAATALFAADPNLVSDGARLRAFIRDVVVSSSPELSHETIETGLRRTLANYPEVMLWIRDDRDLNPILNSAGLVWSSKGAANAAQQSMKPSQLSLDFLEGTLRDHDVSPPTIEFLRDLAKKVASIPELRYVASTATVSYVNLTGDERMALLERIPKTALEETAKKVRTAIADFKLSNNPAVQVLVSPESGVELTEVPEEIKKSFPKKIATYFDKLPVTDKSEIVASILSLPPNATTEQQLGTALRHTGPALQKLFQLLTENAKSESVKGVMKELLAGLGSMSPDEVRAVVERNLGVPLEEIFSEFDMNALGGGTIGETHKARLRSTGEWVAVKLRRPGVVDRALREIQLLKSITTHPVELEILNRTETALKEELDFRIEGNSLDRGTIYNDERHGIRAIGRRKDFTVSEDFLVMDFGRGVPIANVTKDIKSLLQKGRALSFLLDRWIEESIFKNGFFHGDLHGGNILFRALPNRRAPYEATLIDFGSTGTLNLDERVGFALLAEGAMTRSPRSIYESVVSLATVPPESLEALRAAIYDMPLKGLPLSEIITNVISIAIQNQAQLPTALIKFNRGRSFLEIQLDEVNRDLNKLDPERKQKRFDPMKVYAKVITRETLRQLALRLRGRNIRETTVSTLDLIGRATADTCAAKYESLKSQSKTEPLAE